MNSLHKLNTWDIYWVLLLQTFTMVMVLHCINFRWFLSIGLLHSILLSFLDTLSVLFFPNKSLFPKSIWFRLCFWRMQFTRFTKTSIVWRLVTLKKKSGCPFEANWWLPNLSCELKLRFSSHGWELMKTRKA